MHNLNMFLKLDHVFYQNKFIKLINANVTIKLKGYFENGYTK